VLVQPSINITLLVGIISWTVLMDMMFIHNSYSCEM